MVNKNQIKNPPYLVSKGWFLKAFEKFGKIKLDKITRETIKSFNLTSPGNESKMINALKFLKIINEEGNVDQEKYKIFSYSDEKRKEELKKIMEEVYKDIFNELNIEKSNYDDLKDYFIHKYNYNKFQAEKASLTFIFLADLSKIILPKELLEKNKEVKEKKPKKILEKIEKKKKTIIFPHRKKKFLITLEGENGRFSYDIENLDNWNNVKKIIDTIISLNNQGPSVSKENGDPSL